MFLILCHLKTVCGGGGGGGGGGAAAAAGDAGGVGAGGADSCGSAEVACGAGEGYFTMSFFTSPLLLGRAFLTGYNVDATVAAAFILGKLLVKSIFHIIVEGGISSK